MSGSCRGQETGEAFGIWGGKGLEVHTAHDPVLHMNVLMCVAHEHCSFSSPEERDEGRTAAALFYSLAA
jgi:hypothetical protein